MKMRKIGKEMSYSGWDQKERANGKAASQPEELWEHSSASFFTSQCTAHWDVFKEQSSCASVKAAQANAISLMVPDAAPFAVCAHMNKCTQENSFYLTARSMLAQQHLQGYFEKYFLFSSHTVAVQTLPKVRAAHCCKRGLWHSWNASNENGLNFKWFLYFAALFECPVVQPVSLKRASSSPAFSSSHQILRHHWLNTSTMSPCHHIPRCCIINHCHSGLPWLWIWFFVSWV